MHSMVLLPIRFLGRSNAILGSCAVCCVKAAKETLMPGKIIPPIYSDFALMTEIVVAVPTKVKSEGEKRPHIENLPQTIAVADIKKIVRDLKF